MALAESRLAEASEWMEDKVYRHQREPGRLAKARRRKLIAATVELQESGVAQLKLEIARGPIGCKDAQQATWSAGAKWVARLAVSRYCHIT